MANPTRTSRAADAPDASPDQERRSASRTRDDADWESKVIGRLNGRLHQLPTADPRNDDPTLGWEATVLDVLRKRIERESK
jgi:hypothetical protein